MKRLVTVISSEWEEKCKIITVIASVGMWKWS